MCKSNSGFNFIRYVYMYIYIYETDRSVIQQVHLTKINPLLQFIILCIYTFYNRIILATITCGKVLKNV